MKRKYFLSIFYSSVLFSVSTFFVFHVSLFAQAISPSPSGREGVGLLDSLQFSFQKKPHFFISGASKSTFISGYRSPILTARVGLDFDHRIRIGAGLSMLSNSPYEQGRDNTPFYLDKIITDVQGKTDTVHPALQFRYVNLFLEYIYYKSGRWQFSIPIQFGIGGSSYKYTDNGSAVTESKHTILLYEPAVSGHYKITKWFGAGLDVGYRLMLINNKNIGGKFNSPVYDIKVIIFWGEIYQKIFPK